MAEKKFTRIPPRSTGDRVNMKAYLAMPYQSLISPGAIKIGDFVSTSSTDWRGEVLHIDIDTPSTGTVYLYPSHDNESDRKTPNAGESIIISTVSVASIASTPYDIYTNTTSLVSYDNMFNGQKVDTQGAAFVRFPDGPIEIDTAGRARFASATQLGSYTPNYSGLDFELDTQTVVSGTAEFDLQSGYYILSNPTISGCMTACSTNVWHKHVAGQSTLVEIFTNLGGGEKTNVERRWGYFDDYDGFYFYNSGSETGVCIRSSATGTVEEIRYPQQDWNLDSADGSTGISNPSGFNLNLENINGYAIGFEYPSGTVRFSILGKQTRISVHELSLTNWIPNSITRRPSLPVRWEQENVGPSSSTSEMKAGHARVWTEGPLDIDVAPYSCARLSPVTVSGTEPVHLLSLRAKDTFNGIDNRVMAFPNQLRIYTDEPIVISTYFDAIPNAVPTFDGQTGTVSDLFSAYEVDVGDYDFAFPGFVFYHEYFGVGPGVIDFSKFVAYQGGNHIVRYAYSGKQTLSYVVKPLNPSSTATVHASLFWSEVTD